MDLEAIKSTYFAECTEQLAELETGLFSLANDGADGETINSVFRAVHSIKGGAGAFAFDDVVAFAHVFENALDILRNDLSQVTAERLELLLRSSDVLADLVEAAAGSDASVDYQPVAVLLEQEFGLDGGDPEEDVTFEAVPISLDDFELPSGEVQTTYDIAFRPFADLYLCGHDPQRLFRELEDLGDLNIACDIANVPSLDQFNASSPNLAWKIELNTGKTLQEVEAVFEWVAHLCELSISARGDVPLDAEVNIHDFLNNAGASPDDHDIDLPLPSAISDDLATNETETPQLADIEPDAQHATPSPVGDSPAIVVDEEPQPVSGNATADTAKASLKQNTKTIRADSEKVDRLINLMGELVISQSMLSEQISKDGFANGSPTALALVALQNLTREIQSSVMSIRAQPIKPVFMRMSRVVREVSAATGKKAQLILEGEHTEVDTTVIEGLSDPLTHMIRNSVDHGIESASARAALGKPEQGKITLSAFHSSGNIIIQVSDDGAGIDRGRVFNKAVERGIVSADAKLSDSDIDNLIFAPGFSTAEQITDVSGRGVGMDVVRQSIQQLGGRVSITSEPGHGSQFTLVLPLTLAILDGMLVREADQTLVVPVGSVIETLSLRPTDIFEVGIGHKVLKLRDQLIPLLDVGFELGFSERRPDFNECTVLVVETGKGSVGAFVVSSIEGQQQVVIKSIESNYQRIPCISAATILGNGRIALILDVEEVMNRTTRRDTPTQVLEMTG